MMRVTAFEVSTARLPYATYERHMSALLHSFKFDIILITCNNSLKHKPIYGTTIYVTVNMFYHNYSKVLFLHVFEINLYYIILYYYFLALNVALNN